jgi:hypothetical protein
MSPLPKALSTNKPNKLAWLPCVIIGHDIAKSSLNTPHISCEFITVGYFGFNQDRGAENEEVQRNYINKDL